MIKKFYKLTSFVLIIALLSPDVARCGRDGIPQITDDGGTRERRRSLPNQLKTQTHETRATRSRSLGDLSCDLPLLKPQFHRLIPSPQTLLLIEHTPKQKQQTNGEFKPLLNLTELLRNSPTQEISQESDVAPKLNIQNDNPGNIEVELLSALITSTSKQGVSPDHSSSPPTDPTHSSASSSPSKESRSNSTDTEDSDKAHTHSSSPESPRNFLSSLAQFQEQKSSTSIGAVSEDRKVQNEEVGEERNIPLQTVQQPTVPLSHEVLPHTLEQPLEKKEQIEGKDEIISISSDLGKQSLLPIDNRQETNVFKETNINLAKLESALPASIPTTPVLSDASPRQGQESRSRRNSNDSTSDDEDTVSPSLLSSLVKEPFSGPTDALPILPEAKVLEKASSLKLLSKSAKAEAKERESSSADSFEQFIEETAPALLNIIAQDTAGKKDRVLQNADMIISPNPSEKTSLLSNKRPHAYDQKPKEKEDDLTKDWMKTGQESGNELAFKKASGDLTDGTDHYSFEGEIGVIRPAHNQSKMLSENHRKFQPRRVIVTNAQSDVEISFEEIPDRLGRNCYQNSGKELLPFSINGDDPEDEKNGSQVVLDDQDELNKKVLAFLIYAKDHINDGRITLRQGLVGGIGGILIGVGVGNAMPPILNDGLDKLGSKFHYEINFDDALSNFFVTHTAITLGVDSIARSMITLGNLAGPSTDEFSIPSHKLKFKYATIDSRKATLGIFYTGAGVAALLPIYYLWHTEEYNYEKYPQLKTDVLIFFGCLSPALFIDSLLLNGRAAKRWIDERFNAYLVEQAFAGAHFFSARSLRETELKRFRDLERLFRHTPDDEIHDLYEQVLEQGFDKESNPLLSEETIKAADTLRTLKALRQIHKDCQLPEEVKEGWKKFTASVVGWGIPIFALGGRCIVFFKIIYDLLSDIVPANQGLNTVFAILFGEIIASFFQGKVEVDATKTAVYELLGGEETEGDSSHSGLWKGLRKAGKGYNYVQAIWNTLPYLLVGITATQGWPIVIRALSLFFFGLADTFSSAVAFNESYGGAIAGADSLLSYKYATAGYKRNKLMRLVRYYRQTFETMAPNILMRLDNICEEDNKNFMNVDNYKI